MGQTVYMGVPTVVESAADTTPFAALFEDDGKVGTFYAIDTRLDDRASVLDSVYIYHVTSVLNHPTTELDVYTPCNVEITWSADQQRVALVLNGVPHAAFDFEKKRACCKSNFPEGSSWSIDGHSWDDGAVSFLESLSSDVPQPESRISTLS